MKLNLKPFLILILLVLIFTACQSKPPINNDEVCAIDAATGEYDPSCAPNIQDGAVGPDAYPSDNDVNSPSTIYMPIAMEAYPITEDDLTLLFTGWRLENYAENEVMLEPPLKVLSFTSEGTYTLATETELESGTWSTVLLASDASLVLTSELGDAVRYQIIELDEEHLNLRTMRDGIQIDEGYLFDDESCGCE